MLKGESRYMKEIGLVLQGGGALGAYEFGALEALYEKIPNFYPNIISGVSIGAITAAVLAGSKDDKPIKTLTQLWKKFEVSEIFPYKMITEQWKKFFSLFGYNLEAEKFFSLFGNKNFYNMRTDFFNISSWTNFYDVSPLKKTLEELLSLDKINSGKQRLIMTATNVRTGELEKFDSHETKITFDHILASGSLPPSFPMIKIGSEHYWDGGIVNNAPLSHVIEAFGDYQDDKQLIVINLFPLEKKECPKSLSEVTDRVFEIVFSNKIHRDYKTLQKVNEYSHVMSMIDKHLTDPSIKERAGYKKLCQYRLLQDIVYITNDGHEEDVFASFDFSKQSISLRRKVGYEDAIKAVKAMVNKQNADDNPGCYNNDDLTVPNLNIGVKYCELSNGETTAYRESGNGDQVIILVHGNMTSSKHWDVFMDNFPDDYKIYAIDLRGCGFSTYHQPIDSFRDLSDDIKLFADSLKLSNFVLAGWSAGGGVVMQFACDYPERVKKLVLIESVGIKGMPLPKTDKNGQPVKNADGSPMFCITKEEIAAFPSVAATLNAYRKKDKNYLRQLWNEKIYTQKKYPPYDKYEEYLEDMLNQRNLCDLNYALSRFNISHQHNGIAEGTREVDKIVMPTLVFCGDQDRVTPRKFSDQIVEAIGDNARLIVLKDSGHSPLIDTLPKLICYFFDFIK